MDYWKSMSLYLVKKWQLEFMKAIIYFTTHVEDA